MSNIISLCYGQIVDFWAEEVSWAVCSPSIMMTRVRNLLKYLM